MEEKIKEKIEKTKTKVIETYTDDMLKAINQNQDGLIRKIIHEQEEHEEQRKEFSPESKQNKVFVTIGLLFIFIALGGLGFVFLKKDAGSVTISPQFEPLIFTDKTAFLEIDKLNKEEITKNIVTTVKNAELKPGGVNAIYLTSNKKIVGLYDFLKVIKSNLVFTEKDFVSDNFLLGIASNSEDIEIQNDVSKIVPISTDVGGDLFILIKMRSFTDVFKTMRNWEKKMFVDMHDFFGVSLSSETNYLTTKDFENDIIQNKNARILKDKNADIVMMYVFADDNSIIITNTERATKEVIMRLAGSKIKK